MKFGYALTTSTRGRGLAPPELVLEQARLADQLGYHSVWVLDHVASKHRFLDPIVMLSLVGGVTRSVKLCTGILILPARNPLILAKEVGALDYMTGGRVMLGVGAGSPPEVFEVWSTSPKDRAEKLVEGIQLLKKIWSEPVVSFEGKHYKYQNIVMEPKPKQQPLPILMGGHSDAAMRRAAKYADGYIGGNEYTPDLCKTNRQKIVSYLRDYGRDPSNFVFAVELWSYCAFTPEEAKLSSEYLLSKYYGKPYEEARRSGGCIVGTIDECAKIAKSYDEAGCDVLIWSPTTPDLSQIERCATEVMRKF